MEGGFAETEAHKNFRTRGLCGSLGGFPESDQECWQEQDVREQRRRQRQAAHDAKDPGVARVSEDGGPQPGDQDNRGHQQR